MINHVKSSYRGYQCQRSIPVLQLKLYHACQKQSWQSIHISKDKIWKERCHFSKFYQILPSVILNVLKEFNDTLFPLKIHCLIYS